MSLLAYELKYVINLITIKPLGLQGLKNIYSIQILCRTCMEYFALRYVL